ncbi:MAG TPA: family 10 glycosylhydrolase [bacterium]|nr:family 10 glycosylhydrolase [bacterium]
MFQLKRILWSGMYLMVVVFLVAATVNVSAQQVKAEPGKYRAFWVNAFQPDMHTPQGVARAVKVARDYNFNTIIAEVRLQCDAFYNSTVEPKSPLVQPPDYDPLKDMCAQAHDTTDGKQRLEVHAWIVTYRANLNMNNVPIGTGTPAHVLTQHPTWINQNFKGETVSGNKNFLDPGVPGVIDHTVAVVKDIVQNYDVDGIHYDYIRYPEEDTSGACDWGYNPISVNRFNRIYDRKGSPETGDPDWENFRRQQILDLLRKTYVEAKRIKPTIKMSASTVNWGPCPDDFKQSAPYKRTLQDWVSFMKEGVLDINFLMNYKREHDAGQAADYRAWSKLVASSKSGRHGVVGQGAYLNDPQGTVAQMKFDLSLPEIDGTALYCYSEARREADTKIVPDPLIFDPIKNEIFTTPVDPPVAEWIVNPTKGICAGTVKVGKEPADRAIVTLSPGGKQTHTDGTGFYAFMDVEPGDYQLKAKPLAGKETSEKTQCAKGQIAIKDITCKP